MLFSIRKSILYLFMFVSYGYCSENHIIDNESEQKPLVNLQYFCLNDNKIKITVQNTFYKTPTLLVLSFANQNLNNDSQKYSTFSYTIPSATSSIEVTENLITSEKSFLFISALLFADPNLPKSEFNSTTALAIGTRELHQPICKVNIHIENYKILIEPVL